MASINNLFCGLLLLLALSQCSTAQFKNFHTANITINANCDQCGEIIEKAGYKKKEAEVNWDGASKTAHIIYDSKKTTLDDVLKRLAYAGFNNDKFRAPDQAYNALPECCKYTRNQLTPVVPDAKDAHVGHAAVPTETDEHAGHDMPDESTEKPNTEPAKSAAPLNADPHKGHAAAPAKKTDTHAGNTTARAKTPAKQTDPHAGHTTANPPAKPAETTKPAVAQTTQSIDLLSDVYNQYFSLKDALTKDDAKTASARATALEKAINAVPMNKMSASQHDVWMKRYKSLASDAGKIAKAGNVASQRPFFATLSANMHQLTKAFNPAQTVYYQHCPMYNNNKGANWLSREKTIRNPYYGPSMLTCGKTVETIK